MRRSHGRTGAVSRSRSGSFILDRVDVTGELGRIRVPSLFVASDDRGDWSPEAARAAAALSPLARSVTISGARTLVPLEQPERLAAVITEFWAPAGRAIPFGTDGSANVSTRHRWLR